jgi:hypothetical protein
MRGRRLRRREATTSDFSPPLTSEPEDPFMGVKHGIVSGESIRRKARRKLCQHVLCVGRKARTW